MPLHAALTRRFMASFEAMPTSPLGVDVPFGTGHRATIFPSLQNREMRGPASGRPAPLGMARPCGFPPSAPVFTGRSFDLYPLARVGLLAAGRGADAFVAVFFGGFHRAFSSYCGI